jgi:hypothetical protein
MKGAVRLPIFIDEARRYVNTTQLRARYLGATYEAEYCQWQALHGLGGLMETASLIITPNAYLEGKLIASYPPDPIGDMSVVRATTATRVNSAGLVELVPYNLINWSEAFDNADWTKANTTVTANTILSPIGTLTADSVAETTATNSHELASSAVTFSASTKYTTTLYAKWDAAATRNIHIRFGNCASANVGASFDKNGNFVNYTGGSNGTLDSYTSTNVGNGWWKFVVTITTANVTSSGLGIYVYYMDGTTIFYTGNTSQVINFWGGQLVEGTLPKDYQKTETRLNIPRLDYSNGTCPSLLVESQRTNLLTYSSSFDNVAWSKIDGNGGSTPIVTANYGVSPDGTQNAERIQLARTNATSSYSYVYQAISSSIGQSYTWSVWLKSLSGTPSVALALDGASYTNIVTLTNEWQRYEFTTTAFNSSIEAVFILFQAVPSTSLSADFLAYGFQLEAGSYPTSYIPTTSASVTRNADVVSKTGISSLIGQTEGTMFCDIYNTSNSNYGIVLSQTLGDYTNSIYFFNVGVSNQFVAEVFTGGVLQMGYAKGSSLVLGRNKIAITYKNNDFAVALNGVVVWADTLGSVPTTNNLDFADSGIGSNYSYKVNAVSLWTQRLTNTQLSQLTTI